LMDLAGNPCGTYGQEEPCVRCGAPLEQPRRLSMLEKAAAGVATLVTDIQRRCLSAHANWIHMLFEKQRVSSDVRTGLTERDRRHRPQ
jgi:hypothetical protein